METSAKIQLSPEEMELVQNTDWIISKRIIIKKVYEMFGEISSVLKGEINASYNVLFPENIKHKTGKISQGENYQLFPYVILDYPAFFWKDRVFAVRTMFWWGNFFSVTLHLSGIYKQNFLHNLPELLLQLQQNNFFICVNNNEWQHHFNKENYKHSASITLEEFKRINEKDFFKISKKLSIAEWTCASVFIINTFREIMQLLDVQLPSR